MISFLSSNSFLSAQILAFGQKCKYKRLSNIQVSVRYTYAISYTIIIYICFDCCVYLYDLMNFFIVELRLLFVIKIILCNFSYGFNLY